MTFKERCAQSLVSYKTFHRYRMYMDNILLSFFSPWDVIACLTSGAGWFMRHMPVFSWLVWLHSQLSGTLLANTIKIHTCTGLLESQMRHRQSMRKQVIWGILTSLDQHRLIIQLKTVRWLINVLCHFIFTQALLFGLVKGVCRAWHIFWWWSSLPALSMYIF